MPMTIKELLLKCQREKTAVLATNFYNFETLTAVMKAAQVADAPVMLQLTRSSIDYMGIDVAVKMARQAIADYGLQGYIHLDHGGSVELVQRCLDAGFDSVMIDASEKPFGENVETTCKVVEMAKAYGVPVEASSAMSPNSARSRAAASRRPGTPNVLSMRPASIPSPSPSAPPTASTSSPRTSTSRASPPSMPPRPSAWSSTAAPASRTRWCRRPSPTAS